MTAPAARTLADIGGALKAARKRRGWLQADLAREAGVPIGTVRNAEQGRRELGVTAFARLAGALGLGLDELYHGAPPAASPVP